MLQGKERKEKARESLQLTFRLWSSEDTGIPIAQSSTKGILSCTVWESMQNLTSYPVPNGYVSDSIVPLQACRLVLSLVESPAWWDSMHTFCLHRPLFMHTVVTFSQALAFQSLVAQWSINWCSWWGNQGAKKITGSFTGQWKANCKEHWGDAFFHRE